MPAFRRVLGVIGVGVILGGCAVSSSSPAPSASPSAPAAVTTAAATTTAAQSTPSAAPTPSPSPEPATPPPSQVPTAEPAPLPTVNPSFSPPDATASFVTPPAPGPTTAWRSIRWTKYPSSSPASHLRAVVRWSGGLFATGDLLWSSETTASTRAWTSSDGRTWRPVPADAFGANAFVASAAPVGRGLVALVFRTKHLSDGGPNPADPEAWTMTGPWESWTSDDGLAWTGHPGPSFEPPADMRGDLLPAAGGSTVALLVRGQPVAFTADGIGWRSASMDAFPGGPVGWSPVGTGGLAPGLLAVGTDSRTATSADGVAWTEHRLPATCSAERLVAGQSGVILLGSLGDPHTPQATWCGSRDGVTWAANPSLAPLGSTLCRGTCPNGLVEGDGERIVAYRGYPSQAGWTSFDGLRWQALRFASGPPAGWNDLWGGPMNGQVSVAPIGLLALNPQDGVLWLGSPSG